MFDRRGPGDDIDLTRAATERRGALGSGSAMPRPLWWLCASTLIVAGALTGWAVFAGDDDVVLRSISSAGGFAVIGMLIVEAVYGRLRP